VPKQLTPRQRELLEELAATFDGAGATGATGAAGVAVSVGAPGADRAKKGRKQKGIFDKVKETLGLEDEE
jgi:hypothetical protein